MAWLVSPPAPFIAVAGRERTSREKFFRGLGDRRLGRRFDLIDAGQSVLKGFFVRATSDQGEPGDPSGCW
jgi:hypothetical protein